MSKTQQAIELLQRIGPGLQAEARRIERECKRCGYAREAGERGCTEHCVTLAVLNMQTADVARALFLLRGN